MLLLCGFTFYSSCDTFAKVKNHEVAVCFATSINGIYQPIDEIFIPSPEDQRNFTRLMTMADASIMGRSTFDANQGRILATRNPHLLRNVLTHRPEEYGQFHQAGILEFKNQPVEQVITDMQQRGKEKIIIVSGEPANEALGKNLVNVIYLTLEPHIYGMGRSFGEGRFSMPLRLRENYPVKLNSQGTLLLCYDVLKYQK